MAEQHKELHSCIRPRRRFVLICLGLCLLFVTGICACSRPFPTGFVVVFMLEALLLAIPSRTRHGTLLQLVGLVMPFSAVAILLLCGIEEYTGAWLPRGAFWPFAIMFWGGIELYPLACFCVYLWHKVKMQK